MSFTRNENQSNAVNSRTRLAHSGPPRALFNAPRAFRRLADQLRNIDRDELAAARENAAIDHDGVDIRRLALETIA